MGGGTLDNSGGLVNETTGVISGFGTLSTGGVLNQGRMLLSGGTSSVYGFVAQAGQHFDLLDWGTLSGQFNTIDASGFSLAAGTQPDYSQRYTSGEVLVTTPAVPERGALALWLAGLGGLWRWVRRCCLSVGSGGRVSAQVEKGGPQVRNDMAQNTPARAGAITQTVERLLSKQATTGSNAPTGATHLARFKPPAASSGKTWAGR